MTAVRIRNSGDAHEAEAFDGAATPVPGLYVARTPHGWPVVHLRSGNTIGTYDDPEIALACTIDLGLLWDWTKAASGLRTLPHERKQEIAAVCRRWHGRKGTVPATLADL